MQRPALPLLSALVGLRSVRHEDWPEDWHKGKRAGQSRSADRSGVLDLGRILAAFGIVLFHMAAPGAGLGYAALPFFLILLVLMAGGSAARRPGPVFARDRARRLLRPWLIWSALYGALKLGEVALTGVPLSSEFAPHMILTGPALHLWFLPVAFVASLATGALVRALLGVEGGQGSRRESRGLRLRLIAALMALAVLGLGLGGLGPWPVPVAQWIFALPAVAVGLIGVVAGNPQRGGLQIPAGLVAGGAALILSLAGLVLGWQTGVLQLGLAGAALILCLMLPLPDAPLLRQLGEASLGVYLVHPLIASLLMRAGMEKGTLALALVTFGLSLAFALATRGLAGRHRLRSTPDERAAQTLS